MSFTSNPKNLGYFVEKDYGHEFTYRFTTDPWALKHGMIHEIDVGGELRFGIVRKTFCLIVTNEESGCPVLDRWQIKKNIQYTT